MSAEQILYWFSWFLSIVAFVMIMFRCYKLGNSIIFSFATLLACVFAAISFFVAGVILGDCILLIASLIWFVNVVFAVSHYGNLRP
jgi:hypothetical protein